MLEARWKIRYPATRLLEQHSATFSSAYEREHSVPFIALIFATSTTQFERVKQQSVSFRREFAKKNLYRNHKCIVLLPLSFQLLTKRSGAYFLRIALTLSVFFFASLILALDHLCK